MRPSAHHIDVTINVTHKQSLKDCAHVKEDTDILAAIFVHCMATNGDIQNSPISVRFSGSMSNGPIPPKFYLLSYSIILVGISVTS